MFHVLPADIPNTIREYLIASDGQPHSLPVSDALSFADMPSQYVLVRSKDRRRVLLLGFESVPGEGSRVHALLFDENRNRIYHRVFRGEQPFAQAFIQDGIISFAGEDFNNIPVKKVADNGNWCLGSIQRARQASRSFPASGTGSRDPVCEQIRFNGSSGEQVKCCSRRKIRLRREGKNEKTAKVSRRLFKRIDFRTVCS